MVQYFNLAVWVHPVWVEGIYWLVVHHTGNDGGYHPTDPAPKGTQAVKVQPIAVPSIPLDELKEITENFGASALIGEGSYGRVYYGLLKNGQATAIKKLDASKQPDEEFLAQVWAQPLWFIISMSWICAMNSDLFFSWFMNTGIHGVKA